MAQKTLVEPKITEAVRLVQQLDKARLHSSLAAWFYSDEARRWRLLIAGPDFDQLLPKKEALAYLKLVEAMKKVAPSSLELSDLQLIRNLSPLAQALRHFTSTEDKALVRAHFSNTTVNGMFIKEAVILRSA